MYICILTPHRSSGGRGRDARTGGEDGRLRGHVRVLHGEHLQAVAHAGEKQALVSFNRQLDDASRGCTFHCKMQNNCLITVFFLIVVA